MDFYERVRMGAYETALPFGSSFSPERTAYYTDQARLHDLFQKDLAEEYGVANHPKVKVAFSIAWEHGHAHGYHEVACFFADLVPLLQP